MRTIYAKGSNMFNLVKSHEYRPKHRKSDRMSNAVLFGILGAYVAIVAFNAPWVIRTMHTMLDKLV